MLQAFPWTRFSWLADNYVDKELVLHVLMMPLAGMEPLVCARIVGSALGFGLLLTILLILAKEGAPRKPARTHPEQLELRPVFDRQ